MPRPELTISQPLDKSDIADENIAPPQETPCPNRP